jgi:hypothetical protein
MQVYGDTVSFTEGKADFNSDESVNKYLNRIFI